MLSKNLTLEYARRIISENTEEIVSANFVDEPLVSVCFITYNHADFIEEALDSVLMQVTEFPIEIIIGDDASTDNTSDIINRYQKHNPDKIKILRSNKNLGFLTNTTFQLNVIRNLWACRGKYIALLEGDDYWLNPLKLQKQVDCIELNSSYAGSCHDTLAVDTNGAVLEGSKEFADQRGNVDIGFDDTVSYLTPFHISSFVFKSEVLKKLPEWFLNAPYLDRPLMHLTTMCGPICRIPEVMSHYRKHSGGATTGFGSLDFRRLNLSFIYQQMHYFAPNGRRAFENVYRRREEELVRCLLQCNRINEYFKAIVTLMSCWSIHSAWGLFIQIPRVVRYRLQVKIAPMIPASIKNLLATPKK